MTPYDAERQQDIDAEWDRVYEERGLDHVWTEEEVKALKLKEYKPGYYFKDPRYPRLGPVERYQLDHAAPAWIERRDRIPLPRNVPRFRERPSAWDDELFSGSPEQKQSTEPKRIVVRSTSSKPPPITEDLSVRTTGLWLCQICQKEFAFWPREISWHQMIWGVRVTVVLRAPYVCTNCRIMRFKEQRPLGHLEHRPFWNNVIALVTGQSITETIKPIRWINQWRERRGW